MRTRGRSSSFILLLSVSLTTAGCAFPLPGGTQGYTPPGALALDFLKPAPYREIRIDLRFETGAELDPGALDDARAVLTEATGKPVQFARAGSFAAKGASGTYAAEELLALEGEHRTAWSAGETAVVHALVLKGRSTEDPVLAIAYAGSSLAFFAGRMDDIGGDNGCSVVILNPCGAPEKRFVTRSVVVHEVGHLLGLVNHGIPMVRDHEDPESQGHSRNPESVMYKGVATFSDLGRYLHTGEDIPYDFDEDDLADLRAAARG